MKITIQLPDDLMERTKQAALEADITLSAFIENALRGSLAGRRNREPGREFKVTTYGHGGVFPGVNLNDSAALEDIMEPPEEIRKKLMG